MYNSGYMRRYNHYFLLLFLFLLLMSCRSAEEAANEAVPSAVQVMFANDDFAVTSSRITMVMWDGTEVASPKSVEVTLLSLDENNDATEIGRGTAQEYRDYEQPYWTIAPAFPKAGRYGLTIDVVTEDGKKASVNRFIEVTDQPRSPVIGSRPPASKNRTLATTAIDKLSSDPNPLPDLYQMTVAEALESNRPTVITFSTPAFCQTKICAPVLESIKKVHEQYGKQANFLHLEVYKEFQPLTLSDEMGEWGLTTEPWTFVLNDKGEVTARLGGPVSPKELTDALAPLLP